MAVVYTRSRVLQKGVLARVSAVQVTFLGCAVGMVCTLGWAPELVHVIGSAPALAPWTVVYLELFPTAIAFTTWACALKHLPAGRLGATTYVVPALVGAAGRGPAVGRPGRWRTVPGRGGHLPAAVIDVTHL